MARRKTYYPPFLIPFLTFVLIALIVATVCVAIANANRSETKNPEQSERQSDAPALPSDSNDPTGSETESGSAEKPITYTDVTLLSAGDLMFHGSNLRAAYNSSTDTYSFADFFRYLQPILSRYDYSVANLETTFSGKDAGYTPVSGISFNTPDSALDAIADAGFDMMLFANNHTNDRRLAGIKRTVSLVRQKGLALIGASDDKNDDFWQVVDLKGTKLGMLNYTNDGSWGTAADGTLNGTALGDSAGYLNVFYLARLEEFYAQVTRDIAAVKAAGADIVICYIHWGPEYFTEPQTVTRQIAQKLCDLGVDAIIGGHPHVVQPMETLTSTTDPNRKTVCFYSLGNFISNQNRTTLTTADCYGNDSANTENGLMVVLTIRKYSTGQTVIANIELIPTWVHRYETNGKLNYRIIPLTQALTAPDAYGLNDSSFGKEHAAASLAYTEALLSSDVQAFLQSVTPPKGTENAVPAV